MKSPLWVPQSACRHILLLSLCLFSTALRAGESWEAALALMPLQPGIRQLNRTNCVEVMLRAFQSNHLVKALIFMPGATDEFYMFRRAKADLTNASPSLLDAVSALTNQTLIHATFHPPLLLLHTDEDPLEPRIKVGPQAATDKLKRAAFLPHALYDDRDWDVIQPLLKKRLRADIRPWQYSCDSWHFYRHSFAAWDLTGWEALQTVALAGKTGFTVRRKGVLYLHQTEVVFEPDPRVRTTPKLDAFPR